MAISKVKSIAKDIAITLFKGCFLWEEFISFQNCYTTNEYFIIVFFPKLDHNQNFYIRSYLKIN